MASKFLAEVAGKPLPLKDRISARFCVSVFVGVLCLINQLDVAQFNVQPLVDRLDMIAAVHCIIRERKHHTARAYFAPRVIFHGITQRLPQHTVDDIITEELFEPTAVLG